MKLNKTLFLLITLGISIFILNGCGQRDKAKQITIVGSTAMQPLVEKIAESYQLKHQDISINVQGGGSGTGLSQVQQGAVNIGNSDVFAQQQEGIQADKLIDNKVAVVGIAPVVNKKVSVENLSMNQLQKIFTGEIKNWKTVGGPDQKIVVINRAQGSGIRKSFERVVLQDKKATNAQEQDSNGTVQKIVDATPGSISYLSFSYLNNQVKPLMINEKKPNRQNVIKNQWKIWSYEHVYIKKDSNPKTIAFVNYMMSKHVQKNYIPKLGFISINEMEYELLPNNQVVHK